MPRRFFRKFRLNREKLRKQWWIAPFDHLLHDPNLDSIRGEPGFQQLYAELQADLAEQAERVRDLRASGELTSAVSMKD